MKLSYKQLRSLVIYAKKQGLKRLKVGSVEIEFFEDQAQANDYSLPILTQEEIVKARRAESEMLDTWSSS